MDTRALKERSKSTIRTQVSKTPLGKATFGFLDIAPLWTMYVLVKTRVWTFILQITLTLRCIGYAVWTQSINLFVVKIKVENDKYNNCIDNLSQAETPCRGRNSVFQFFISTHLYTRCNHIWKESKGKTHNSKQRQGYKCFGSGKAMTSENIHCKCCDSDLKMKQ